MEKQLDKARDFGVIYGQPGLGYEQDGTHFAPDGSEVEAWSSPEKIQNEAVEALKRRQREEVLERMRNARESKRKAKEDE